MIVAGTGQSVPALRFHCLTRPSPLKFSPLRQAFRQPKRPSEMRRCLPAAADGQLPALSRFSIEAPLWGVLNPAPRCPVFFSAQSRKQPSLPVRKLSPGRRQRARCQSLDGSGAGTLLGQGVRLPSREEPLTPRVSFTLLDGEPARAGSFTPDAPEVYIGRPKIVVSWPVGGPVKGFTRGIHSAS